MTSPTIFIYIGH